MIFGGYLGDIWVVKTGIQKVEFKSSLCSDKNLGLFNENMVVSGENLGVHNENMGVSGENLGVYNENLGVSEENLGVYNNENPGL